MAAGIAWGVASVFVLVAVDVQGAQEVFRRLPSAIGIFLLPPSFAELEARLRRRAADKLESVERRLRAAGAPLPVPPARLAVAGRLKSGVERGFGAQPRLSKARTARLARPARGEGPPRGRSGGSGRSPV